MKHIVLNINIFPFILKTLIQKAKVQQKNITRKKQAKKEAARMRQPPVL